MPVLALLDIASLKTTSGGANSNIALVSGYEKAGDGGGGTFVWDKDSTAADDNAMTIAVKNVAIGRWVRPPDGPVVVKWFGAKGDGITDDRAAIQAAIDYAIYLSPTAGPAASHRRIVYIPEGTYVISGTIHLGYGAGPSTFTSITLQGAGPRYDIGSPNQSGTALRCNFTDRPGINVQGARQTRIRGLTVQGKYDFIFTKNLGYAAINNDLDVAAWQDPDFPTSAYTGYSAYVGIAIDAYAGPAPATAYPPVTYPAFLGGTIPQYNKSKSSDVLIEDVDVTRFCVAIGRFSDENGNGEFIRVSGGQSTGCIYGLAISHTQARNTAVENYNFGQCYTAIAGNVLGDRTGNLHGCYLNVHFGGVINLITGPGGWSGPVTLRDCYAESFARIGQLAATGDATTLTLDNCYLSFREQDFNKYGVPDNHAAGADTKLIIRNSSLRVHQFLILMVGGTTASVVLDGAQITAVNATTDPLKTAVYGTAGVIAIYARVHASAVYYRGGGGQYYYADSDQTNSPFVPYVCSRTSVNAGASTQAGHSFVVHTPKFNGYNYFGRHITLSNRSGATVETSRTGYVPGGTYIKLDLGDALRIEDAMFVVTAIPAPDVAQLTQVSNFRGSPGFVNTSQSDILDARVNGYLLNRCYIPDTGIAAAATAASATLTGVKRTHDGYQFQGGLGAIGVDINDLWVASDDEFVNVGGISTKRFIKITAEDEVAHTLTLSAAVPFTKGTLFLQYFMKVYNP